MKTKAGRLGLLLGVLAAMMWMLGGCQSIETAQKNATHPNQLSEDAGISVEAPSELVRLLTERLKLGKEVAWTKYRENLPIQHVEREQQLLARMRERAVELGLDPELVVRVFNAQIVASKEYQNELIEGWRAGQAVPETLHLDLVSQIRPQLDELGRSILQNLDQSSVASLSTPEARQYLKGQGFSDKIIAITLGL